MSSTVFVAHRLDPVLARRDVGLDAGKVLVDMLLGNQGALLIHIKVRQPVVNHERGGDIGRLDAVVAQHLGTELDGIGMTTSIGGHEVEIGRIEGGALTNSRTIVGIMCP